MKIFENNTPTILSNIDLPAAKSCVYGQMLLIPKAYSKIDIKTVAEIDGYNLPEVTSADNYISTVDLLKDKLKVAHGKEYKYDGINNVVEFISAENKSKLDAGKIKSQFEEQYIYDGIGRKVTINKAEGNVIQYKYDILNNNTEINISSGSIKPITVVTNKFDGLSRLISSKDGDGYETTYKYNNLSKLQSEEYTVDINGTTTEKETKSYMYDPIGNISKWINTKGEFESYAYDNLGRVLTVHKGNPKGNEKIKEIKEYDANGNPKVLIDANGARVDSTYDEYNRLTEVMTTTMPTVPAQNTYSKKKFIYDKNGTVLSEESLISKDNKTYTTISKKVREYDNFNRLIKEKNATDETLKEYGYKNGSQLTLLREGKSNNIVITYDKNNRALSEKNNVGKNKEYQYNMNNQLSETLDGEKRGQKFTYDIFENISSVNEFTRDDKGVDSSKRTTKYQYDNRGNLITQQEGVSSTGVGKTTTFKYNGLNKVKFKGFGTTEKESYSYYSNGNLKTLTDNSGNISTYQYDKLGNLESREVKTSTGTILNKNSYINDNKGNIKNVIDAKNNNLNEATKTYDNVGRLVKNQTTSVEDSKKINTLENVYDILSFDKTVYKDAVVAEKTISPSGDITSKAYDVNGRLKYVVSGDISQNTSKKIASYTYRDNHKVDNITYGDGSLRKYDYYTDYSVRTLSNIASDGKVNEAYTYTYYLNNNPRTLTKAVGNDKEIQGYFYDSVNRLSYLYTENLVGGVSSKKRESFGYNSLNDMVVANEERLDGTAYKKVYSTEYKYINNRLNKQIETDVTSNTSIETSLLYDTRGNLTTIENKNGKQNYTYDGLNRLTTATQGGKTAQYVYNGEDIKVGKIVGANKTSLIYKDKNVVEEYVNGKVSGKTYYGEDALYRDDIANTQKYYYYYNTHKDVTEIRLNNQLKKSYKYDAFGKEVAVGGDSKVTVNNPIRYAGYYYEEESKLYYLNARMYNPTIKRFMQQDTVRGESQNPNTLNLYAYSGNNPISNYDPTGNFFETLFDLVSLATSVYDFVTEPSLTNFGMLAWDLVSLAPGVPGSYVAKGAKYLDRVDDAVDTVKTIDRVDDTLDLAKGLDKLDDAYDMVKGADNLVDAAKAVDKGNDIRKTVKSAREVFEEVAQKAIKSGDDVVKDGRVIATSAKKAAQKSYEIVGKVNNKIADVQNKIFSKTNNIELKIKAYGKDKVVNVQSRNVDGIISKKTLDAPLAGDNKGNMLKEVPVKGVTQADLIEGSNRLGGKLYGEKKMNQLSKYLDKRGIKLDINDEFLNSKGANGGFDAVEGKLILRSDATEYEVMHELSHYIQYKKLGKEEYLKLSRTTDFNAPEQFVFDMLENNKRRWYGQLNEAERNHASWYIYKAGGMR